MKLSKQAIQVLEELKSESPRTVESLEAEGYDQAMVNRAALELEEKGLAELEEEEELEFSLTDTGEKVKEQGSPEYRLLEKLEKQGTVYLSEDQDFDMDVALGKAKQRKWIEIHDGEVELTAEGDKVEEDKVREQLESGEYDERLVQRGLLESVSRTEKVIDLTAEGKDIDTADLEEDFNVEAPVKTPRTGKKHFYRRVMDYARKVWLELGFEEMRGDYVTSSFMCFDALYIAQDHPSRDLQDTFFMENPERSDLSEYGDKIEQVSQTHENGWETGSTGWKYEWSRDEAEKNILRTHTTVLSAIKLSELERDDLPAKFFSVGRAFRNETVDRTHLADFDQTEGIVVGEDLNFSHLKGYLTEFFEKMGYDEFRLVPTYYPYTEMSAEIQVWDEEDEEWLGMGGSGLFRPEVVQPLLGFEATVLAWGLGIGRIGMQAAELTDIRGLYRNDIQTLEKTPLWHPER